jgi:NTE family protein
VVLSSGPLFKGIAASAALPVLFNPVAYGARHLIDGGVVNPLPFDILSPDLDIVVAVDVVAGPEPHQFGGEPSNGDILFGTAQLMLQAVLREKLKTSRPDVLLRPDINAFKVLDFMRAVAILEAADAIKDTVKREVERALEQRLAAKSPAV